MALTDEEKRLLAQLEASLAADDPQLAQTLRGTAPRSLPGKRIAVSIVGMALGLALLLLGMQGNPLVSVLGFLVMLAASAIALGAWRAPHSAPRDTQRAPRQQTRPRAPRARHADGEFMDKVEDRWRRRRDEGL